jgi:transcriptional regulator with XRE-family HTH domain
MKLKKWLQLNNITQKEFAMKIRTSTVDVNRWINSATKPSLPKLYLIKEATGGEVDLEDFVKPNKEKQYADTQNKICGA